ncbi:uncharacterized protein G2W53_017527 [Senna tora]|uniref:Uncharacterized protein n=1 Tax=Senna tora TaxID=362788 RepID=A0A834TPD9_9FABA|nr:uncharacterized protein G2W53_017527 [Senna tora]
MDNSLQPNMTKCGLGESEQEEGIPE